MSEHTCVLCRFYRPNVDARHADDVLCPGDRARLERDLLVIPGLFARVVDGEPVEVDRRWYQPVDGQGRASGQLRRRDPVAATLPVGAVPARVHRPAVTGTRDTPLPIDVDAVDLTAAPRAAAVVGDPRDQVGFLPVASVLDGWARHLRDVLHPDFHLPAGTVRDLVAFLHTHLDDAVRTVPAATLVAFAGDLCALGAALRRILRDSEPVPQPLQGVRCGQCKTIHTLVPWPTGQYVECRSCGQLYNPADRAALAAQQLADVTRPRTITVDGRLPALPAGA